MGNSSVRIMRIAGIDIRVHASWLIVFALVTWSLAEGYYPGVLPGLDPVQAWLMGAVSALLLFASVLVHELAHSLVARSRGLAVDSITLFVFGGVSSLRTEPPRATTEFLMAIVGPLTSLGLAVAFWLIAGVAGEPRVEAVFVYLAVINGLLGLFNLIPGYPLDGGRVLRAIVWRLTGDMRRGLTVAVAAGQVAGYALMLGGLIQVLGGDPIGGIWIAVMGWFLQSAGAASLEQARAETRLAGIRVADVVRPDATAISPDASVEALIEDYLLPGNRRALPVVADGRLVGIVSLSDIQRVPPPARGATHIAEVMGGRDGVVTVAPEVMLAAALTAMLAGDFEQLPVVDHDCLVGVLTRADILRQLQLRAALRAG